MAVVTERLMTMRLFERVVLHYESDKSDKVYIVELLDNDTDPETFSLITSWGRRAGPRLSCQIRHARSVYYIAREEMDKIVSVKKRAGYVQKSLEDMEIPGYNPTANDVLADSSSVRSEQPSSLPSLDSLNRGIL